jgi:hypothetical protein
LFFSSFGIEMKNEKQTKSNNFKRLFEIEMSPSSKAKETFREPDDLHKWKHKSSKGFFCVNPTLNEINTQVYSLELSIDSTIFVSIELNKTNLHASRRFVF